MKSSSFRLVFCVVALAACTPIADPSNSSGPVGSTQDPGPSLSTPAAIDAASQGGACAEPTGSGTEHSGTIMGEETWTAAASPHLINYTIRILGKVTIEPCAVVLFAEGMGMEVGNGANGGTLVASGEITASGELRPVIFAPRVDGKSWGTITVDRKGFADLRVTVLANGGNGPTNAGGGALVAWGDAVTTPQTITRNLRAIGLIVLGSRGYGVNFTAYAAFTEDSDTVVVSKSGSASARYPVYFQNGVVGSLPPNSQFVDNFRDEVGVRASDAFVLDDAFHERGVPYHIEGRIRVEGGYDGSSSTLTIDPGVTLRFETTADSGIRMGTSDKRLGTLIAKGTASSPITFTSAKDVPLPGDWSDIYFNFTPPSGNAIEHAIIEYAGAFSGAEGFGCGPKGNDASVLIMGRPTDAFIKNTTFRNAGGDTQLLLGWSSDQDGPDFVASNTFADAPSCHVSRWQNATGVACPGAPVGGVLCF